MLGILRINIKCVNRKTCVHQISEINLMKQVQMSCGHISAGVHSGGSTM